VLSLKRNAFLQSKRKPSKKRNEIRKNQKEMIDASNIRRANGIDLRGDMPKANADP
jgi:hypothetical protein